MLTPNMGNRLPNDRIWAADTGCYSPTGSGGYSWERYEAWLMRWQPSQGRCLFATAPDVVGDAAATLERSAPILPLIRGLGYRAALVAQDGLEAIAVPWDSFDCLFMGGTTRWKLSEPCYALMRDARERGKWIHAGRVNSLRRLRAMAMGGAHSADGTYVAFGPDVNIPKLQSWMDEQARQPSLFMQGNQARHDV